MSLRHSGSVRPAVASFLDGHASPTSGAKSEQAATPAGAVAFGERCAETARLLHAAADSVLALAEVHENQLAASRERADMEPVKRRPLLAVKDVAEIVGVDERTVRRWRDDGLLPPAITVGGVVRWEPADIEAWIAERKAS